MNKESLGRRSVVGSLHLDLQNEWGTEEGAKKSVPGRGCWTSQSLGHDRELVGLEEMRAAQFGQRTKNFSKRDKAKDVR